MLENQRCKEVFTFDYIWFPTWRVLNPVVQRMDNFYCFPLISNLHCFRLSLDLYEHVDDQIIGFRCVEAGRAKTCRTETVRDPGLKPPD